MSLKEWLVVAGALGIPVVIATDIWKKKVKPIEQVKPDPTELHKSIEHQTLEEVDKILQRSFDKELDSTELSQLETKLNNDILSKENLQVLEINETVLKELIYYVLDSKNSIEDICQGLENFYLKDENIYNPQKRYVLSYIIYEASKLHKNLKNKNIYNKLFEVNEKVNQKLIIDAIKNQGNPMEARKTIANLLFLEHLGILEFNYKKEKPLKDVNHTPEKEYASSPLAYEETVVLTLTYDFKE